MLLLFKTKGLSRQLMKLSFILLTAFILLSGHPASAFAGSIPESIRVALQEGNDIASVLLQSNDGFAIGFISGGNFTALMENKGPDPWNVYKDTAWHIIWSKTYGSWDEAEADAKALREEGIRACPANDGAWRILTGEYKDADSARLELSSGIAKGPEGQEGSVVIINSASLCVKDKAGKELAYFLSQDGSLTARSLGGSTPVIKTNTGTYRGDIEITRKSDYLLIVNVVQPQQYLYSVVASEIGGSAPMEAMKAQAVAARNYMLQNLNKHAGSGYNLCNKSHCQAYKGYASETADSVRAVDETEGMVLTYDGKLAQCFYFSSSGGMTEDVKNVWGSSIPYLISVEDTEEDPNSRNYNWTVTLTKEEIKNILDKQGKNIGEVTGIRIDETAPSGRVTKLVVTGTNGEAVFQKSAIRNAFGPDTLYSQWFTVASPTEILAVTGNSASSVAVSSQTMKVMTGSGIKEVPVSNIVIRGLSSQKTLSGLNKGFVFTGKGWGHAVGMSQVGARGYANKGMTYDWILAHYFPGTTLEKW